MSIRSFLKRYIAAPAKRAVRPVARPLRNAFLLPAIKQLLDIQQQMEGRLRDFADTAKMTDRTLLAMGVLAVQQPKQGGPPRALYVDMRAFQDPFYAFRGIGFHSSGVLRHVKKWLGDIRIIGIADPSLPTLPEEYRTLVDEIRHHYVPDLLPAVVLHPSPMTHDPSPLAPLFTRPDCLHVALVYDFIPLEEPERYLPTGLAHRSYMNCLAWLRNADLYCPISRTAGDRLKHLLAVEDERIAVTGACVRDAFTRPDTSIPLPLRLESKSYFLVVGGGDKRKNVETALAAHAPLRETSLVIAGHYEDDHVERLRAEYSSNGGDVKRLHFAKGMTDGQLAALYRHARATIVPSRSEGFSLPVAEAVACGCPVLVSGIPAHRELVGDSAFHFDSDDGECLRKLLLLPNHKMAKTDDFSEASVAGRVWSHVKRKLERIDAPAFVPSLGKPRIAFLTPLPPERSGVADYSERTLEALSKLAVVDVYTNRADCRRPPGPRRYEQMCDYPYLTRDYDRVVTVIANSTEYNRKQVELLKRYGGPAIAHDARMFDFHWAVHGIAGFARMLSGWLKRPVDGLEVEAWFADQSSLPTLCFEDILPKAAPLVVHSKGIRDAIRTQYGIAPEVLPFCTYRRFADDELTPEAKRAARARLGLPADRIIVVSLGIVAKTKAPEECMAALRLLRDAGVDAELHFVGTDGGVRDDWDGWLDRHGVRGKVHFPERWIDEATYRDYAVAADLALQLRTHRFGGVSGALADCIAAGLPTVANRDLAEAIDSPAFVQRVDDKRDPKEIAERMRATLESFKGKQTEARREYEAERNFEAYSLGLLKILKLG